ncbi:TPA: RHS repeat protein [Morganella morganii]|nr:RHS repeat protein [Morganella morganii subsp. morganii]HDU8611146.1 RHS repeat protein [Morganella morganii]
MKLVSNSAAFSQCKHPGFRYDRFGRLKALVNEKEESYRFEYDALHRLIREKSRLSLRLTSIKNYFKIHNYFDK